MRVDLHIHSISSRDCLMSPDIIIRTVRRRGLDAIALTDHNTIAGALALAKIAPFPVIIGEEIKTTQGEIVGLFLQDEIAPGQTPEETIEAIRAQRAIAYIPHPLDRLRSSPLKRDALYAILDQVDALEGLNARVILPRDNHDAQRLAAERGLAQGAGSDAHCPYEIGRAFVEMPAFSDRDSFLQGLAKGKLCGRVSPPWVHLASTWAKRRKMWMKSENAG